MVKRTKGTGALSRTIRRLREQALETPPGELIGSETELVGIYEVSRPTLRQAAALLSQEQLVTVRRGVGGGYFARRPQAGAVAHISAIYLQSRHTTLEEILKAIEPIKAEMAVLAAQNRSPEQLEQWRAFQQRDTELERTGDYREFLKSEREFSRILGPACGNRVLDLFVATLYEFCSFLGPEEDVYRDRPDRVHEYWSRRELLVAAIIDGDAELAAFSARRCARMVTMWMVEDIADHRAGKPAPLARLLK